MTHSVALRALAPLLVLAPIAVPGQAHGSPTHRTHGAAASVRTSAVSVATRAATIEPAVRDFVNAGVVYAFSDNAVYRLYTAPERVSDIALQSGETLVAVASGDTVRWVIGDTSSGSGSDRQVHVLVKPVAAGLTTNLVITTDRRTYHLALTSSPGPAMAALSWSYPQDALLTIRREQAAAEAAAPVASGLAPEALNFTYAITGDWPAWRPLRAFDDGQRTYIEFPASIAVGEAPPLFLVDGNDAVSLVNYRVQGRYYVVDRIFDAAELRLGAKKQAIVRVTRTADNSKKSHGRKRP
jgi:type IV secretion system protein VirB9